MLATNGFWTWPWFGTGNEPQYNYLIPILPVGVLEQVPSAQAPLPEMTDFQVDQESQAQALSWNAMQPHTSNYQETLYCSPGTSCSTDQFDVVESPQPCLPEMPPSCATTQIHLENNMVVASHKAIARPIHLNINNAEQVLYPHFEGVIDDRALYHSVNPQRRQRESREKHFISDAGVASHKRQTECGIGHSDGV
ncbi:hypothetical protein Micbo1qcDRAFT_169659 [Microdochium bolleyi]|uniref:Uncharacterized protein n=1 Tax=Microdochium bolleyi TaxID=196109 RepID=A0A136IKE6_9PEZI|nr:hypothetical protein Micbo1qcDRAFT_169659 [Microdochium bolleyi]